MRASIHFLAAFLVVSLAACGGDAADQGGNTPAEPAGLTQAQLEKGIGPITSVDVSALDAALAAQGEQVFTVKCSACHKMADRYVGPPLGTVASERSPEFIMNMILNPEEMIQKHPDVKAMLGQFMTPMPNQHLTEDEARAVLEYLRAQVEEA